MDAENNRHLKRLPDVLHTFQAVDTAPAALKKEGDVKIMDEEKMQKLFRTFTAPERLSVKKGAQV